MYTDFSSSETEYKRFNGLGLAYRHWWNLIVL